MNTNKTFCTHTLVKNGMPFIELVLKQVLPYANRCLVTISERSKDNTLDVLRKLQKKHPKIKISFEKVQMPRLLTHERQKQVDKTYEDWILFLDDDDYWPEESIKETLARFDEEIDGIAVSPYQVIDEKYYDSFWYGKKFFTKWFRNGGITYHDPWPRDLIYKDDSPLYWKKNHRVSRMVGKYFHLPHLKGTSFRNEAWTKDNHTLTAGDHWKYPEGAKKHIWKIYEELNKHKTNK